MITDLDVQRVVVCRMVGEYGRRGARAALRRVSPIRSFVSARRTYRVLRRAERSVRRAERGFRVATVSQDTLAAAFSDLLEKRGLA